MRTKTVYLAFDDTPFDMAEACKAYEAQHVEARLVGLTIEQVRAALNRDDTDLADAIEEIGNRIGRARREAGDLRRGRKAMVDGEAPRPSPEATDPEAKIAEAVARARAAGLLAWNERKGAVVPEAFAGAKPLHNAWLDGWAEGQALAAPLHEEAAA